MERPGRDDEARLLDWIEDCQRLDRDAVIVGRGQSQLVSLELGEYSGQDRPGLVRRGGEGHFTKSLTQNVLRNACGRALTGRRNCRKLVRIDALDSSREPAGLDMERLLSLKFQVYPFVGRQAGNYVGQQPSRHRHRTARIDFAGHPVRHSYLEVRGGQLQAAILGSEEDVIQDRQCAPGGYGPGYNLETPSEVLLHDRQFHVEFTPLRSGEVGSESGIQVTGSDPTPGGLSIYLLFPSSS